VGSTIYFSDPASSLVTVSHTYVNAAGVAIDPTTVSVVITDPTGAAVTYTYSPGTIVKISTGNYAVTVGTPLDGLWQAEWFGTGASPATPPNLVSTFSVFPPQIARWYCSLEEVKSRLGKTTTDSDFEIELAIQAAARDIEGFCGRYFWQGNDVRTYVPEDLWRQPVDDIVSVTTLQLDTTGSGVYDTTWTPSTQYVLEVSDADYNVNASGEPRPYTQIRAVSGNWFPFVWPFVHQNRIQVTGVFGWPAVPPMVKQACLLIASDLFKLREAPFGQAGFAEYGVVKSTAEPMIADMLRPYVSSRRKVGI
jgi:hypothetical protein